MASILGAIFLPGGGSVKRSVFLHLEDIIRDQDNLEVYIAEKKGNPYFSVSDAKVIDTLTTQLHALQRCMVRADDATLDVIDILYLHPNPNLNLDGIAFKLHMSKRNILYKRNKFLEDLRRELGW